MSESHKNPGRALGVLSFLLGLVSFYMFITHQYRRWIIFGIVTAVVSSISAKVSKAAGFRKSGFAEAGFFWGLVLPIIVVVVCYL